jgi:tRNA threonylcarbamoyladenosine biosynthesis protein TsaB
LRILGFDTATRSTAVAVWDATDRAFQAIEARDDPRAGARPNHTSRLMTLIIEVLERSDTTWAGLDRIAVGVGPGTFTGLRIGIATARALGRARGIPLVGVSTLRSLALGAQGIASGDQRVRATAGRCSPSPFDARLAVLDARRGEVFAACWRAGEPAPGPTQPLLAPRALAPAALARLTPELGRSVLAIGEGAVEFRKILERSGTWIPEDESGLHRVTAINHCRLAGGMPPAGDPDEVRPEYLRLPDAEITFRDIRKP